MSDLEILSLIITIVSLLCFSVVFTFLFRSYFKREIDGVKKGYYDIDLFVEEEQNKEKGKGHKVLDISFKVVQYVFLGAIAFLFLASVYERVSGGRILIGDSTAYVIASGSMSEKNRENGYLYDPVLQEQYDLDNQFNTYDVIGITRYASQDDVSLYDVVAFTSNTGTTIVHRIVEIENIDGTDFYITRGDSNGAAETDDNSFYGDYLSYESIIGYYNGFRIPAVGAFVIFLQSGAGIVTIVSIIYCFLMFEFYRNRLDKATEERRTLVKDLIAYDGSFVELKTAHVETITYNGRKHELEVGKDDILDYYEDKEEPDKGDEIDLDSKEKEHGKENADQGQQEGQGH